MSSWRWRSGLGLVTALGAVVWSGCLTVNVDGEDGEDGGKPGEETPANLAKLNPLADEDGDGLANGVEIEGWTIRIDSLGGVEAGIRDQHVTSNPFVADTDKDGLSDLLERAHSADPRVKDTDGDGLSDAEEVSRWQTSPANVDTDGDARGFDPDPNAAPDSKLFDGAELALRANPADPMGIMVPGSQATSPIMADTDGDGMSDFDEVNYPTRSPILAEVPEIKILQDPASPLDLALNVVRTSTREKASEISSSFGAGLELGFSQATTLTQTMAMYISVMAELMVGAEVGANIQDLGAQVKASLFGEFRENISLTTTLEVAMSQTAKTTLDQMVRRADTVTQTETLDVESGRIQIGLILSNPGKLPFSVKNVGVNVAYHDPFTSLMAPIAVLEPVNPQEKYTLRPGEQIKVLFAKDNIPALRMMEFMRNPSNLSFSPVGYEILTAGEEEYDFILADVYNKTATVMVDFGDGRTIRRHLAAHIGRDAQGRPQGVPVADLLTTLGVPWEAKPLEGYTDRFVFELDTIRTEVYFDDAPDMQAQGLDPVGYPATGGPGPRKNKTLWVAMVERDGERNITADFFHGTVLPGDKIFISLARDKDRDGVSDLEERLLGTSDNKLDSDGDGLSDYFEAREGWEVLVEGQASRYAQSVASKADTDGDGLSDREELELGTHPRRVDTDFDELEDRVDIQPTHSDPTRLVDLGAGVVPDGVYPNMAVYWRYQDDAARQALVLRERVDSQDPSPFNPRAITSDATLAEALAAHAPILTSAYRGAAQGFTDRSLKAPSTYTDEPESARSVVSGGAYTYHFYTPYPIEGGVRMVYSGSIHRRLQPEGEVVDVFQFEPKTLQFLAAPDNDLPQLFFTISLNGDKQGEQHTPMLVGWKTDRANAVPYQKNQLLTLNGPVRICKPREPGAFIEFSLIGGDRDDQSAGDPDDYVRFSRRYDYNKDAGGFAQLPTTPSVTAASQRLSFYQNGPPASFPPPGQRDDKDDARMNIVFNYEIRYAGQIARADLGESSCYNYLSYKGMQ